MRLHLLGVSLAWLGFAAVSFAAIVSLSGCAPPPPSVQPGSGGPAESAVTDVPPAGEDEKPADMPAGAETEKAEVEAEKGEATKEEMPTEPEAAEPEKAEPAKEQPAEPAKVETPPEPAKTEPPAEPAKEPPPAEKAESSAVVKPAASAAAPASGEPAGSGDWPMWGGTIHRNMVNPTAKITNDFSTIRTETTDKETGGVRIGHRPRKIDSEVANVLWTAQLGSQTYGNPVVAQGKVFVGTNNGATYRPKHTGDRGCVLCFDEKTGKFLWQLTREKLPQGRVNDWPEQGICSTVAVDGQRMYVVTNRCELMCVDTEGFYDGENDGPVQDEPDNEQEDADIVWNLDMIETLGVFPHNLAASSPVVSGDFVYVVSGNGVDESHLEIPAPRSPSFLAVNKSTGEVAWENNDPFDKILHGQWSSPAIGLVDGQAHVYFAGGNGWLYGFEAQKGELLWKFDLNPKDAKYELQGRGTRNYVIATPVFVDNSVLLATGQDPEHGDGVGHLWRVDATKRGDVSSATPDNQPNPNSAQIWHLGGFDTDGSVTGKKGEEIFRRTLSTVAVHGGLVYAADLSGRIHCVDFKTGQRYGETDLMAAIWGSPMVADGKVFVGDEDGILSIFATDKDQFKMIPRYVIEKDGKAVKTTGQKANTIGEIEFESSIYSTPTIANGVMFVSSRSLLYAIATQ